MRPPPRPFVRASAHAAGTVLIVVAAMTLATVLPALIGPVAVLAVVGGFGVAAWAGAAFVIQHVLPAANDPAANDNAPMPASSLPSRRWTIAGRVG